MRIAIVTDAWAPQINGVVRTLQSVRAELQSHGACGRGDRARIASSRALPDLSRNPAGDGGAAQRSAGCSTPFAPDAIHLATEGPLVPGRAALVPAPQARLHHGLPHPFSRLCAEPHRPVGRMVLALFPLVSRAGACRAGIDAIDPRGTASRRASAQTPSLGARRRSRLFRPDGPRASGFCRSAAADPAHVGRVAVEKNIEAFLALEHAGHARWWSAMVRRRGRPAGTISRRAFPRSAQRRELASRLSRRRCARLSQPHRHLRAGHDRGAGQRHAGRGLSGDGADRCADERCGAMDEDLDTRGRPRRWPATGASALPMDGRFTWARSARRIPRAVLAHSRAGRGAPDARPESRALALLPSSLH